MQCPLPTPHNTGDVVKFFIIRPYQYNFLFLRFLGLFLADFKKKIYVCTKTQSTSRIIISTSIQLSEQQSRGPHVEQVKNIDCTCMQSVTDIDTRYVEQDHAYCRIRCLALMHLAIMNTILLLAISAVQKIWEKFSPYIYYKAYGTKKCVHNFLNHHLFID